MPGACRRRLSQVRSTSGLRSGSCSKRGGAHVPAGNVLLFDDDFESATVCGWSSAVPPVTSTWYLDSDADSFGDPAASTSSCAAPLDSLLGCLRDTDADDFGSDSPPIFVCAAVGGC